MKDLIYSAQQGFPDAKRHLHGRVNAVIQDKLGDRSFHVGENWVDCRLEKWGKSISYIGQPHWTQFVQGHCTPMWSRITLRSFSRPSSSTGRLCGVNISSIVVSIRERGKAIGWGPYRSL